MAEVSRLRAYTGYTDDYGTVWKVLAETGITSQAKLGETALVGTEKRLPKGIKKRFTTVRDETDLISRKVTVYATNAPILTTGATINLNHYPPGGPSNAVTFTSSGAFVSEVRPRGVAT